MVFFNVNGNNVSLSTAFSINTTPTPSVSNMILVESGQLLKSLSGSETVFFPIGTTSQYSPATITLNSFNTGGSPVIGITLKNTNTGFSLNNPALAVNQVWQISHSDMTNVDATIDLTYVDGDIQGTEANYFAGSDVGFTGTWTIDNTASLTPATNQATFNFLTTTPGDIAGNYAIGEINAFQVSPDVTINSNPTISNTDVIAGQTDVMVYALELIETGGTIDALLDQVDLSFVSSNFTNSDFNNFRLYLSTDAVFDGGDTQLGVSNSPSSELTSLTFSSSNFPVTIPSSGTRYLLLIADVSSSATSSRVVSLSNPSIGVGGLDFFDVNATNNATAGGFLTVVDPIFYSQGSAAFDNSSNWNTQPSGVGGANPISSNFNSGAATFNIQTGHVISASSVALDIDALSIANTGSFEAGTQNFNSSFFCTGRWYFQ